MKVTNYLFLLLLLVVFSNSAYALEVLKPRSDKLHNDPKWKYLTLDTGHDAMITSPNKLSLMLLDLVEK